jgi:hypothetical protein
MRVQCDVAVFGKRFCSTLVLVQNFRRMLTIVLGNLVSGGLILVEVVFPIEAASVLDLTVQSQSGAQRRK